MPYYNTTLYSIAQKRAFFNDFGIPFGIKNPYNLYKKNRSLNPRRDFERLFFGRSTDKTAYLLFISLPFFDNLVIGKFPLLQNG